MFAVVALMLLLVELQLTVTVVAPESVALPESTNWLRVSATRPEFTSVSTTPPAFNVQVTDAPIPAPCRPTFAKIT